MRIRLTLLLSILVNGLWALPTRAAEDARGIPLKPDPPFAIDGDLGDWSEVPGALTLNRAEQVVFGPGSWTSPKDLSGVVRLAWRPDNLYVAASVTDDQLRQTQRGDSLWKGDHLELYLDAQPDLEPGRGMFGVGQFQMAFSPGNFMKTGDPLIDCAPEAICFRPADVSLAGVQVAARLQPDGWSIEVAIPWAVVGITNPERGLPLRLEVGLSDTDSPEPKQETMMTSSTEPWARQRTRLVATSLAGSDGKAQEMVRRVPVTDALEVARGAKQELRFTAPPVPAGREAVLALKARMASPKAAGHTPALRILLNGKTLDGDRLLNKPRQVRARGGAVYSTAAGDRFMTSYSPDFTSPDKHATYALLDGLKSCEYELQVSDLLRDGENTLVVENAASPNVDRALIVAEARLEFRVPSPAAREKAGPPTGPLPTFVPATEHRTAYQARDLGDGKLEVKVAGETFLIESRYSTPKPAWETGGNDYFTFTRRVEQRPEAIVVFDTFTNRTGENLGIQQRHALQTGDTLKSVWLAGLEQPSRTGAVAQPANPTAFATTENAGLGLLALNDVFRVHINTFAIAGQVGIADENLVLKPGASYTAEWAIVPTSAPDYWHFLNASRRLVDANFLIDGGFAFLRAGALTEPWSDELTERFIRLKDARYVCASIPSLNGRTTHGTLFQQVDPEMYRKAFERRRRLVPGVQNLVYFHCFLDASDDAPERFKDSRTLRPDGTQADYGRPELRLFLPTETNSYGRAVARNVDIILDQIKAEGVYWDEHEYSAYTYHYGEPWDGLSGDIDPQKKTVTRLKTSVTLLTEPWRLATARRILAKGPLIGNGIPVTRAMAALKFPCFVETGSITNCTRAQFYSPIALGDHLTERKELDAYRVMLGALDYGCLYHWYNDVNVIPTHHHLTRYMFPFTPLELHSGFVIGKERIVTKKSGLFGWGDASAHEVHVFNDEGVEVEGFKAPLVRKGGKTYTELRLAEDWSAAIIRR